MEKQYCKVGTSTPFANNADVISILEHQYNHFMNKASEMDSNRQLVEFFERKAQKIQKTLEELV